MIIMNGYFPEMFTKKMIFFMKSLPTKLVKSGRVEKMSKSKKNVIDPNIIIE